MKNQACNMMGNTAKKVCVFVAAMLTGLFFLPGSHASAQPTLPDLDPNVVEIRSRAEISFPSLPRPSLSLLIPPPGAFQLAADRSPLMGSDKQSASSFPRSSLQPPPAPAPASLARADRSLALLGLEGGRFFTRRAQLILDIPVTSLADIFVNATYRGSDGHSPFDDRPEVKAGYDAFKGAMGLRQSLGSLRSKFSVDGFFDKFNLFGADTTGFPVPAVLPQPLRSGTGLGASLDFASIEGSAFNVRTYLRYGASRYKTELFESLPRTFDRAEKRLDGILDFSVPFGSSSFFVKGDVALAGLDTDAVIASDHLTYNTRAGILFQPGDRFRMLVGGQISGYDASDINTGGPKESTSYILPVVRIDAFPGPGLHLYARQDPMAKAVGLVDMMEINPYVVDEPVLKPTIPSIDVEGGFGWQGSDLKINLKAGYTEMKQRLFFEETDRARYADYKQGVYEALYAPSRTLFAGVDLSFHLFNSVRIAFDGVYQDGELIGQNGAPDTSIPYFANLVGNASALYFFEQNKGSIELNARMSGERFTDRSETVVLNPGGVIDAGVRFTYDMLPGYTLSAAVERINGGSVTPWKDYPVEQFLALAGIKIKL